MSNPDSDLLYSLLTDIEQELKALGLWSVQPPPADAFDSSVPFFADRMDFDQWLQWVFLARFHALLDGAYPLPDKCDIAPMAEETLRNRLAELDPLLALLRAFDSQFDS